MKKITDIEGSFYQIDDLECILVDIQETGDGSISFCQAFACLLNEINKLKKENEILERKLRDLNSTVISMQDF